MRSCWQRSVFVALVATCSAMIACAPPPPSVPAPARTLDGNWARLGVIAPPGSPFAGIGNAPVGSSSDEPGAPPLRDWALDWQVVLDAPITVTPAVVVHGATGDNVNDRFLGSGRRQGVDYIGAASGIYCDPLVTQPCPTIAWASPVDSPITGSLALSVDGSTVYGVSGSGTVYSFATANGASAGASVNVGASVSTAAPWLDFLSTPNDLYVGDLAGKITRIALATHTIAWQHTIGGCGAIHSSPVVWNNVVWAACDDGALHRLNPATGAEYSPKTSLCAGTCGANDKVYSALFIDSTNQRLLVGVNNRVIQLDVSQATGCSTGATACAFTATTVGQSATFYSMPFADVAGGFVWVGFNNKLWRAPYTAMAGIAGAFVAAPQALAGANADLGYPKSLPMVFNGHVFIADGGGFVNRYNATTMARENITPQYGFEIDSTPLVDFAKGNIYYSTAGIVQNGNLNAGSGSWVQLTQTW